MDLTPIVRLLPAALQAKAKAVAAAVLAVCTVLAAVLPLVAGLPTWVGVVLGVVLAAATSLATYQTPLVLPIAEHQTVVADDGTTIPRAADTAMTLPTPPATTS